MRYHVQMAAGAASSCVKGGPAVEQSRFHSPYRHWATGLMTEIALTTAFVGVLVLLALAAAALG